LECREQSSCGIDQVTNPHVVCPFCSSSTNNSRLHVRWGAII